MFRIGNALYHDGEHIRSLKVLNEARNLFARDGSPMLHNVESMIELFKGRKGPETVKLRWKVREDLVRSKGKEHQETIFASAMLAKSLVEVGMRLESQRLLEETVAIAKRVLGPEHERTSSFEALLIQAKKREAQLISENEDLNDKTVEILKLTKDGNKYIIQFVKNGEMKKVKVPPSKLMLNMSTPVICLRLNGNIGHIKGFVPDAEESCHLVQFMDGRSSLVSLDALRVVFK